MSHDSRSNNPGDACPESLLPAAIVKERLPEYVRRGRHLAESVARNEQQSRVVQVTWNRYHRIRLHNPSTLAAASADNPAFIRHHAAGDDGTMAQELGIREE